MDAGCPNDFVVMFMGDTRVRRVSETPTPTGLEESMAVHLQFVRQYAPHLYRRAFLASMLRRKGTLQYASHLYCSTPPICTAVRPPFVRQYFWKNTGGWGHRKVPERVAAWRRWVQAGWETPNKWFFEKQSAIVNLLSGGGASMSRKKKWYCRCLFYHERRISPKRKFLAGYPVKNFGQALQILAKKKIFGMDVPDRQPWENSHPKTT